jgi:hypothetical protein
MNAVHPRIFLVAGLATLAACGDAHGPVDTAAVLSVPGAVVGATLLCNATVSTGAVSCREKTLPGAGSRVVIGGPNGGLIQLTSSNVSATPDTFAFDVTVLHRIVQALGTTDGTTAHSSGVRVFFSTPPYTTSRVDEYALDFIDVANEDGSAVFEGSTSRPYFQYAGLLPNNTTSSAKRWKLELVNVNTFAFEVKVWGEVRYPNGWTTITPTNPSLSAGGSDEQLRAIVRDVYGQATGVDSMAWTSSNSAVVTVTPTAKQYADIQGVATGTAWVRAVSTTSPTIQRDSVFVTVY